MEYLDTFVNALYSCHYDINFDKTGIFKLTIANYEEAIAKVETFADKLLKYFVLGLIYERISRIGNEHTYMVEDAERYLELVLTEANPDDFNEMEDNHELLRRLFGIYHMYNTPERTFKSLELLDKMQSITREHFWNESTKYDVIVAHEEFNALKSKYEKLNRENEEMKQHISELETHIRFSPEGDGFFEAKAEFEELAKK